MVALTVALPDGRRMPLLARVGQKLSEALGRSPNAELHASASFLSPKHGYEAHVRVAHTHELPALDEYAADELRSLADEVQADSRLASTLTLTPDWNGAVVALAPLHSWKSL